MSKLVLKHELFQIPTSPKPRKMRSSGEACGRLPARAPPAATVGCLEEGEQARGRVTVDGPLSSPPCHFLLSDRPGLTQEMGAGRFSARQGPPPVILFVGTGCEIVQHMLLDLTGTSTGCFA